MSKAKQEQVDKALDMTFPASDPPASNRTTGTEPPRRPVSRQAPIVSKDEIESAARRRQGDRAGQARHRGAGRAPADDVETPGRKREGSGRKRQE